MLESVQNTFAILERLYQRSLKLKVVQLVTKLVMCVCDCCIIDIYFE